MILMLMWQPLDATAQSIGAADGSLASILLAWRPMVIGVCAVSTVMAVIGVHSIMSGTATADFGGKKSAATATGVADAFSKLGSAIQAFVLGILTTKSWTYWPMFLFPFTIVGLIFAIKMWSMLPAATKRYLEQVEGKKV
jgi:OPA family glycerol-3-phosphate transporter-like MFS transporter